MPVDFGQGQACPSQQALIIPSRLAEVAPEPHQLEQEAEAAIIPCLAPLHLLAAAVAVVLVRRHSTPALMAVRAAAVEAQAAELALVETVIRLTPPHRRAIMAAAGVRTAPHTEVAVAVVEPVQQEATTQQRPAATAATERHRQFLDRLLLTQAVVAVVAGL